MIRKVQEEHHHSPDEVRKYVAQALAVVAALEIEGDLRTVAFSKAIDLLAAKQIWHEQVQGIPAALLGNHQR